MAGETGLSEYFNGTHEVQECLEGQDETSLNTHWVNCRENPGHQGFIPINDLRVEHFQTSPYAKYLYKLTKAAADLTVRIAVEFSSLARPQFIPGTLIPYSCYASRGKSSLHAGTGRVIDICKHSKRMKDYRTCPCPLCADLDEPSKVWWEVDLWTAKHVVFDESEGKKTSCRLWFDNDASPDIRLYGWKVDKLILHGPKANSSFIDEDFSSVTCVTHDVVVADKLKRMVKRFAGEWWKVRDKYPNREDEKKLAIIVSHPHGCSKVVSVGQWVNKEVLEDQPTYSKTRYTYTTCTCSGSSGALVLRPGYWPCHPHSGVNALGLNHSAADYDPKV